jgi:hypothetical protein
VASHAWKANTELLVTHGDVHLQTTSRKLGAKSHKGDGMGKQIKRFALGAKVGKRTIAIKQYIIHRTLYLLDIERSMYLVCAYIGNLKPNSDVDRQCSASV